MPPKKKGKKKIQPMLIDGVDTSQMSREQLEAFALRLKAEMDRERQERNYFQLERDKMRTYWELSRQQLQEVRTELHQKIKEIALTQEAADMDANEISQQMKHLQFENHVRVREAKAKAMVSLKAAQEQHALQAIQIAQDKRDLKARVNEVIETQHDQLLSIQTLHKEEMVKQRHRYERENKDLHLLYSQRMRKLKTELLLITRMQMFEIEERKNEQIQALAVMHDLQYNDMKNYYNDITLNNLGLITSLKEQLDELRKASERSDRIANETMAENRALKEPLEEAQTEMGKLQQKMEHYDRDRNQLARVKSRNRYIEKQLRGLTWETEALILRNEVLVHERDNNQKKFHDVMMELQQKLGLKNVLLERKVDQLTVQNEKRELYLQETVELCNIKETMIPREKAITEVVDSKNKKIEELTYEVIRLTKMHDDLLATFQCKMELLGVPPEEMGFQPLRAKFSDKNYNVGPAGITAANK